MDIYYYKDIDNVLSLEEVKVKEFSLLEKEISEGYDNFTYWFKIPTNNTNSRYIFKLIVLNKTNKEIANDLNISVNTVKFHVKKYMIN